MSQNIADNVFEKFCDGVRRRDREKSTYFGFVKLMELNSRIGEGGGGLYLVAANRIDILEDDKECELVSYVFLWENGEKRLSNSTRKLGVKKLENQRLYINSWVSLKK